MSSEHAVGLDALPDLHRDPFDGPRWPRATRRDPRPNGARGTALGGWRAEARPTVLARRGTTAYTRTPVEFPIPTYDYGVTLVPGSYRLSVKSRKDFSVVLHGRQEIR